MGSMISRTRLHLLELASHERVRRNIPTPFSSMIFWTLVFAADIVAGLGGVEAKNLRRNEMLGNCLIVLGTDGR